MPEFLHKEIELKAGDMVEIVLKQRANVMLLDTPNYESYRKGEDFKYHGGHATKSPVRLAAPHSGTWHLVLDLAGTGGTLEYSINMIKK